MSTVEIGKKVPDFELPATGDQHIKLSDLLGKNVVIYFYPKDSTSGCTTESCEFRDALPDFSAADAAIVGVSRDSVKSHANFTTKQGLNFPLISDPDETLCKAFDVLQIKKNYGKEYLGIERSTFIINPDGVITHVWRKVKVAEHVATVFETLKEAQS